MADADFQWKTFGDFRAGLHEGRERDCPPNGLIECTDAWPQSQGGLEPGFQWTTRVNTTDTPAKGFTPTTGNLMLGFQTFPLGITSGALTSVHVRYLTMIASNSSFVSDWTVWRSHSSVSTDFNNFSTVFTHLDVAHRWPVNFVSFSHTTGSTRQLDFYYNVPGGFNANTSFYGLFKTVSTQPISTYGGNVEGAMGVEVHQGRILYWTADFVDGRIHQRVAFSDDGTDNFSSTLNSFIVAANRPDDISFMRSRMPGDLAILKRQHGWFNLQGPLAINPSLYEVSRVHPSAELSFAAETPRGLAYLTRDEGVWAYTGGPSPVHLSTALEGSPMTSALWTLASTQRAASFLGQPVYAGRFLFTPKGYIWNGEEGWWAKTSPISSASSPFGFFAYERTAGLVYAARTTPDGGVNILSASINEGTMVRSTAYQFTPKPMVVNGKVVTLRELEYHVETPSTNSQIEVIITGSGPNGDVVTTHAPVSFGRAKHQMIRIPLRCPPAHAFKIQSKVRSLTTDQAPTVHEPMRVAYSTGPGVRPS